MLTVHQHEAAFATFVVCRQDPSLSQDDHPARVDRAYRATAASWSRKLAILPEILDDVAVTKQIDDLRASVGCQLMAELSLLARLPPGRSLMVEGAPCGAADI